MPISPIPAPGVEVYQNFVTNTATPSSPVLPSVVLAPCYRVVDALDSDGNPVAAARAGAYANASGQVALGFPDYPTGAVLDEDSVEVYLQAGNQVGLLNGPADEVVVQTATNAGWSYDHAGGSDFAARELTLVGGLVNALGLVAGDVIRVTWPANQVRAENTTSDLVIEEVLADGDPNADTVVKITAASSWGYDLTATGKTFRLVKNPAQYSINGTEDGAQYATLRIGPTTPAANAGLSLRAKTAGSAGDNIQFTLVGDGTAGSETVVIDETANGWSITLHYEDTVSTWAQMATALYTAFAALGDDSPVYAGASGADLRIGTGAGVAPAITAIVALGDYDGTGTFLFDGGADANTIVLDPDLLETLFDISAASTLGGYALVTYRALRLDVTAAAAAPALLSYGNRTEMLAAIGPEDTRNPLGLMMAKMFDAAPTTRHYGLGIGAVSTAHPYGTPAAYSAAFVLLATKSMHAIGVLSQAPQVHQLLLAHIQARSSQAQKREAHGYFCRAAVTHAADVVLLSGTADGAITEVGVIAESGAGDTFASGDNFSGQGVEVGNVLVIDGETGPYVLGNGLAGWKITAADTDSITVNDHDADGVASTDFPTVASGLTWAIYSVGASITSTQDRADAHAEYAYGYAERRMIHVMAPEVTITVDGAQQRVVGSYAIGSILGLLSRTDPQQPLSNNAVPGIDRVHGTSDTFDTAQLDLIAGGGNFTLVQDTDTGPVSVRHQLTTDTSTVEKMHLSIQRVLDFVTFDIRALFRPLSGKQNITPNYLDTLFTQLEGRRTHYLQRGLLADFRVNAVQQSEDSPTTTDIDVTLDVWYPGDTIRTTLNV